MTKDFSEKFEYFTRHYGVRWKDRKIHDAFRLYCNIKAENPGDGGLSSGIFVDGAMHRVVVYVDSVVPMNVLHYKFWLLCGHADKIDFGLDADGEGFIIKAYFEQAFDCVWRGEEMMFTQSAYRNPIIDRGQPTLPESGRDKNIEAMFAKNFKMVHQKAVHDQFLMDLKKCELHTKRMFHSVENIEITKQTDGDYSVMFTTIAFDTLPFTISGSEANLIFDFYKGANVFSIKRVKDKLHMIFGYSIYAFMPTGEKTPEEIAREALEEGVDTDE